MRRQAGGVTQIGVGCPLAEGVALYRCVAAKAEAERRIGEWFTTGRGLASPSLYDAVAFFSTGLGGEHTHDGQIGFLATGYTPSIWEGVFRLPPTAFFEDPESFLDSTRGQVVVLPNPVQLTPRVR